MRTLYTRARAMNRLVAANAEEVADDRLEELTAAGLGPRRRSLIWLFRRALPARHRKHAC
jgi:hypothetical protein